MDFWKIVGIVLLVCAVTGRSFWGTAGETEKDAEGEYYA